jgi:site-specific DNA-methyltransferase (adenine-specific)
MQVVAISSIKPNPSNPRFIKDDKFHKLVQSLKDFPEMANVRPIVVNQDMIILGGNMRYKAMKEAKWNEVPVQIVDWDQAKQREFIIKDNVGFGEWDYDDLANNWDADELTEWGLDISGFVNEETIPEVEEDDFDVPEGGIETDIVRGDLFEIGQHKLLCGSSTETDTWQRLFEKQLCDMVMTDPPYNVNYEGGTGLKIMNDQMTNDSFYQFLYDFYTALGSYTKPGGAWYVWHADSEGANFRQAFKDSGLLLKQCLIWVKNALVMGRQDYHWKHEPCLYGWKEGAAHYFTDDRTKTTIIEDIADYRKLSKKELLDLVKEMTSDKQKTTIIHCDKPSKNDVHPTMKPIKLLAPLIENSSKIGELVADGFLGSGSTMVAAHQLKRKCYGMELDPKYCQVIVDRMLKLDPTLQIKRNGQPYLTEGTNQRQNTDAEARECHTA